MPESLAQAGIRNWVQISPQWATAGQPTAEQLAQIKAAGYEVVINLLPPERRDLPEEEVLVTDLGMKYINIPVVWTAPTPENLAEFFTVMDRCQGRNIFVHCAVNMRVSAFTYLYRIQRLGVAPDEAEIELHDIWVPDGVWAEFIAAMLAEPPGKPDNRARQRSRKQAGTAPTRPPES